MTIQEIYDQYIKPLPMADRLLLARLIVDEAGPAELAAAIKAASLRFDELLQEAISSGPASPITASDWDHIRQQLKKRTP